MKPTEDKSKTLCTISDKTKFTDNDVIEASCFQAENTTMKQVDQIPMHATSLVVINSHLCSTLGINLHVNITYLDLHGNYLRDVDLKFLVNLEYLDLNTNYLQELDSISGNKKIKTLNLMFNEIKNVDFVATLPQLKEFNIEENMVQDLQPIYKHSNFSLSWISVQKNNQESKLEKINMMISYMDTMADRYRENIKIIDGFNVLCIHDDQELIQASFIYFMLKIQEECSMFTEIIQRQQNPVLKTLFITKCHNIAFGNESKCMQHLWICNSDIKSLYGLEKMEQLVGITLRQCSLSRIQDQLQILQGLPRFRHLDVAQNGIDNATYIKNRFLVSLNLSQNKLKSVKGFHMFEMLKVLDVSGNQLSSVYEICFLTELTELNISYNFIRSIQCLFELTNLVYFNLMHNKVSDIEVCLNMWNLIDLRTNGNQIQNELILFQHQNYAEGWLSQQLDEYNIEVKKSLNIQNKIGTYHKQVQDNSLVIKNDQYVQSLYFSDSIKVTNELFVDQCNHVVFDAVPHLVQNLIVKNSCLMNIFGLDQMTQLTSLDLSDNQLEDVTEIQKLTLLTKLVLSNNRISRLPWINKTLFHLKYLDIQNNKFVSVECLNNMHRLVDVFIEGNMIQDTDYLKLLQYYNEKWISPQKDFTTEDVEYYLGPNSTQQMVNDCVVKLINTKKQLHAAFKYRSNLNEIKVIIRNEKDFNEATWIGYNLVIKNDNNVTDLSFVGFMGDLLHQRIPYISVDNCPNLKLKVQQPNIKSLVVTNCKLSDISNMQIAVNIVNLDLGFNNLKDVSVLKNLTNLQKLILRDNKIIRMDHLKSLVKLEHLDVRNNKLLCVNLIKYLPLLSELLIDGNCISDLTCIIVHPKCCSCIGMQQETTLEDVSNYLPNCTKQQIEVAYQSVLEQMKQRDALPQYISLIQTIRKCQTMIQPQIWITFSKQFVSRKEFIQILKIGQCDSFGDLWRLTCDLKDPESVLSKINEINSELKPQEEQFNLFSTNFDDLHSFVNVFKIQKLIIEKSKVPCENYKLNAMVNVKALHVNNCDVQYIEGIENWKHITELSLQYNQIRTIQDLEYLTNLINLNLNSNQISYLKPLMGMVNLSELQLNSNRIHDIESLKDLTQLKELYLNQNQIQNIDHLKRLTNLMLLHLSSNQINNINVLKYLVNLTELDISKNQINNFSPLKELYNIEVLILSSNKIQNIDFLEGLDNLTVLNLFNNQIKNVEILKECENLQNLNICRNQVKNIDSLKQLEQLTDLDLRFNQIKSLDPIQNHPNRKNYQTCQIE
ncbi:Conserved_hypothetical protein [Hexamita inflata]|uniref:Uncharacterized protein n=1 Tax=Hexamita inflata TaxID=28002 RepID=A0AA86QSN8_9EUKA|nr:Conserved hypothetical protein [Hexamita inflata]